MSSVISKAAMEAVNKQTIVPQMYALRITCVTTLPFSGTNVLKAEIISPTEPGFPNPTMAYVTII